MLYEYALDPKVISDKASARFFLDAFQPEKGRLISQFPKKWKKMVYAHCRTVLPDGRQLKYIEERLRRLNCELVRTGRNYNPDDEWVINATESHRIDPFHAIISTAPGEAVLNADDVDDDIPKWGVPTCCDVPRSASGLAACCRGLLRLSKTIIFFDPHCSWDARHRCVLTEFSKVIAEKGIAEQVEYHAKDTGASVAHIERALPRLIGLFDCPFLFIRWRDKPEPPPDARLHARGIITDHGAVDVEGGLDTGNGNTSVKLLDMNSAERLRRQYSPLSDAFEFVDGWCIKNGQICSVTIQDGLFAAI